VWTMRACSGWMTTTLGLALASAGVLAESTETGFAGWVNLTLYHTNQLNYSAGDVADMNTADALGDLEFTVRAKMLPLECADPAYARHASYDCSNPEQDASDLGVTKLVLQVAPHVGKYCPCNVHAGIYSCESHDSGSCSGFGAVPVGVFLGKYDNASKMNASTPDFIWYGVNTLLRFAKGMWYSSLGSAQCPPGAAKPVGGCSWRVLDVAKRVHRECSDKLQEAAVKKAAGGCFEACPQPNNSSSACWIGCFYRTMLGPHVGSQVSQPSEGMPRASVLAAWDAAFAPSSEGGCPSV